MRSFLKILPFFFFAFSLKSQIPHFRSHPFPAEYFNTKVSNLLETDDGFLWFGTSEGVFEYDGLQFRQLQLSDSTQNFHATALFQDQNQIIWIGTNQGDIYYLDEKKHPKKWMPEEGTPTAKISGFEETGDGIFWISTYGEGLYYYLNGRMYNIDEDDGLSDVEVYTIARHRQNHVLIGTDAGIDICKIHEGKKQIHHLTKSDGLSDEIVKTILSDENGNFWVGTYGKGVDYWDSNTQTFQNLVPDWDYGQVTQLELFKEKELWIGTGGSGLFRYHLRTKQLEHINIPIFENSKISDLHRDVEGNLWVLNNTNGISSANRQFEHVYHDSGNVQAVLTDQQNQIWLGTANGLFRKQHSQNGADHFSPYPLMEKVNVLSLFEDTYGFIWIGTFDQGLFCLDPVKNKTRHFTFTDGLLNENILSITGSTKKIWLATLGGVFELETDISIFSKEYVPFQNYNYDNGLGTDFIYKAYLDSKNRTWFGTDGKGISVLQNGVITNYPEANGIPLKAVYTITEDFEGHIWFSTAEQGIFEFDGNTFTQLNIKEGIRDLQITGMVTDELGNIIIVHPSGVDILNPQTKHLIYYDDEVGLQDLEPSLNATAKDKNGNIYLGANKRIIRYTTLKEPVEIHPRTQIKSVNIFFEPVDFYSINKFDHTQNSLVFNYIGLWYSNPKKVEYRYKLEGYNLEWIHSKDQQAHYSNLTPGDYTFMVSSTENGAFDGEPVASYSFTINAPFWQQAWFVMLYLLVLAGLVYTWIKWKSKNLQREADIQKERVESQLEVLKSQINPHFLFNSFNTLISLIEEEPEAATEYVQKLSDFYRSLLQYREKDLIPLEEELELLHNFTYLLKMRFGKNIRIDIPELNEQTAFVPPLTLQILVENAIKHNIISKSKPLHISININETKIYVSNNLQKKLTKEKSTHFGLQSIRSRFALLNNGEVSIEETEHQFKVTIPIIEKV